MFRRTERVGHSGFECGPDYDSERIMFSAYEFRKKCNKMGHITKHCKCIFKTHVAGLPTSLKCMRTGSSVGFFGDGDEHLRSTKNVFKMFEWLLVLRNV